MSSITEQIRLYRPTKLVHNVQNCMPHGWSSKLSGASNNHRNGCVAIELTFMSGIGRARWPQTNRNNMNVDNQNNSVVVGLDSVVVSAPGLQSLAYLHVYERCFVFLL